jgi:hypothetical protein
MYNGSFTYKKKMNNENKYTSVCSMDFAQVQEASQLHRASWHPQHLNVP